MGGNPSSASDLRFFTIAVELNLLSADVAEELTAQSAADGVHPSQLVLRKGLLDHIEIDIIETLRNPDETVADFEILGLLGKGGMGVVYRARQKSLNRIVALKTILVSQISNPALAQRFEREAMTVARLQHPNIVAAYDFGKHDGRMYFVMELVEGQDVEQFITQQKTLDELDALGLIRQAAAGLSHAGELGIVHRDIKPANLLLVDPPAGFHTPRGLPMVKIADFGLAFLSNEAQTETRLTAANATLGSPHYMAPEQIAGESIDHRADIYALGATLYHMLAGRPPFQADSISKIIAQKLSGKCPAVREENPAVSEDVSQLVQAMMNHEPDERLSEYSVLLNRLDDLLQISSSSSSSSFSTRLLPKADGNPQPSELEKTILATSIDTSPLTSESPGRSTRNRVLLLGIPVLVLGIIAAVAYFAFGPNNEGAHAIPPRDMVRSGWASSLFNGKTLGALPINGGWVVEQDEESGQVIAGTSGTIRQPLLRTDLQPPRPLKNYRLLLFVRLHEASAVELHFGITIEENRESERTVFRITPDQVLLAGRDSERGELRNVVRDIQRNIERKKLHVVQLEYQHGTWWVEFDEQLIGTVRSPEKKHLPEFRLKVEDGPAWFSDLSVEELIPKPEAD